MKAEVRAQLPADWKRLCARQIAGEGTKDILDQQLQQAKAGLIDRQRITDGLARDQEKLKQLMDRFNSLMDEGRYVAADEIGEQQVPEGRANPPIAASATMMAHPPAPAC